MFRFHVQTAEYDVKIRMDHQLCPQSCRLVFLRVLANPRPLQILSPFCAPLNTSILLDSPSELPMNQKKRGVERDKREGRDEGEQKRTAAVKEKPLQVKNAAHSKDGFRQADQSKAQPLVWGPA